MKTVPPDHASASFFPSWALADVQQFPWFRLTLITSCRVELHGASDPCAVTWGKIAKILRLCRYVLVEIGNLAHGCLRWHQCLKHAWVDRLKMAQRIHWPCLVVIIGVLWAIHEPASIRSNANLYLEIDDKATASVQRRSVCLNINCERDVRIAKWHCRLKKSDMTNKRLGMDPDGFACSICTATPVASVTFALRPEGWRTWESKHTASLQYGPVLWLGLNKRTDIDISITFGRRMWSSFRASYERRLQREALSPRMMLVTQCSKFQGLISNASCNGLHRHFH